MRATETTQAFLKLLEDPNIMMDENKRRRFFAYPLFQPYFLISYAEFLQIWGFDIQDDRNPERIVKWLIYTQIDWYNNVYNEAWAWKWYPLLIKFTYNTVRLKPTSFVFSFLYIASVEFLFDRYMVFKHLHDRKIKINQLFNHNLVKKINVKQRQAYFEKYKALIKRDIEENLVPMNIENLNFIVAGQRTNLQDPTFEWEQEKSKHFEQIRLTFFLRNAQVALLWYRINTYAKHISNNISSEKGRNKLRKEIKTFFEKKVYTLPERLKQEQYLFRLYRKNMAEIPDGKKFESLLNYPKINQQKRYLLWEDFYKLQLNRIINTYNFITTGVPQFQYYPLKVFSRSIYEYKPCLRTENYILDFATFTLLCIIPVRLAYSSRGIYRFFSRKPTPVLKMM